MKKLIIFMFSIVLLGSCTKTTTPQTILDSALVGHWESSASTNVSGTRAMVFHSDGTAHIDDSYDSYIGFASSDGNILTFSGQRSGDEWSAGASYEYSISGSELTITTVISKDVRVMNGTYNKQ